MNFAGQGQPLSADGMDRICDTLGVEAPVVWTVVTVETRGFGFLQDRRPRILFERHIFHRLTNGRHDAGNEDVSNGKPGGYVGGPAEYTRLEKALELDREAALQSASWGIGQVMGFNFTTAGFATVDAMIAAMVKEEDAQLMAMANFIRVNNLAAALQHKDWAAFARGYNGADFRKNEYDSRLAAAHATYRANLPDLSLRSAQAALYFLGIDPGPVDGLQGRQTRAALLQFQQRSGLPETGTLDPGTASRLLAEAFPS